MKKNELYFGDNLEYLEKFAKEHPDGFIDLIYIDPPFNSKRDYNILYQDVDKHDSKAQKQVFKDTWSNVEYEDTLYKIKNIQDDKAQKLYSFLDSLNSDKRIVSFSMISYLTTMGIRIYYMRKVLRDTGSFYLHCDPTMSHYLKIICDLIFGVNNFRNEIVWLYRKWNIKQNQFPKNHDIILFYSKSRENIFNTEYIPKSKKSSGKGKKIQSVIGENGKRKSVYLEIDSEGTAVPDWWDIPMINPMAIERMGYPTQKPEVLLERLISASSNKGDLVADFFCGCGTTIAVANKLGRKWIGVDISHLAIGLIKKRLTKDAKTEQRKKEILSTIEISGFPTTFEGAKELAKQDKGEFKFEDWIIEAELGGVCNKKRTGIPYDGFFTFSTGKKTEKVLVEVKSGHANKDQVIKLRDSIKGQDAGFGIFVCFDEYVTKGMIEKAKSFGKYKFEKDGMVTNYDIIQVLTVEDLLNDKKPNIPESIKTTYTR